MLSCRSDPGFVHTRQTSTHTLLSHIPGPTSFFLLWNHHGLFFQFVLHTADTSTSFLLPQDLLCFYPPFPAVCLGFLFTPHHCLVGQKSRFPSFCSWCLNDSLDSFGNSFVCFLWLGVVTNTFTFEHFLATPLVLKAFILPVGLAACDYLFPREEAAMGVGGCHCRAGIHAQSKNAFQKACEDMSDTRIKGDATPVVCPVWYNHQLWARVVSILMWASVPFGTCQSLESFPGVRAHSG